MASFSIAHWLVVAVVVLVLFGRGKISQTMGDFGQGIRSFRKGLSDDDGATADKVVPIAHHSDGGTPLTADTTNRSANS